MIAKTTEELRQMVVEQSEAIRMDIANAINQVIRTKNSSVQEFANALGMQVDAIQSLLNGTRDITLKELITLAIATDKVFRIEDINEAMNNMGQGIPGGMPYGRMPQGRHGMPYGRMPQGRHGMPRGGMIQPPPFGAPIGGGQPNPYGGQMPPQFGAPIGGGHPNPYGGMMPPPPFGAPIGGSQPNPYGGMMPPPQFGAPVGGGQPNPYGGQMPPQFGTPVGGGQPNPYGGQMPPVQEVEPNLGHPEKLPDWDEMSTQQLIQFVKDNVQNWQQSIGNLATVKRSDIIDFLNHIPTDDGTVAVPHGVVAAPQEPLAANDFEAIGRNIAELAQSNPSLAAMLENIMRK